MVIFLTCAVFRDSEEGIAYQEMKSIVAMKVAERNSRFPSWSAAGRPEWRSLTSLSALGDHNVQDIATGLYRTLLGVVSKFGQSDPLYCKAVSFKIRNDVLAFVPIIGAIGGAGFSHIAQLMVSLCRQQPDLIEEFKLQCKFSIPVLLPWLPGDKFDVTEMATAGNEVFLTRMQFRTVNPTFPWEPVGKWIDKMAKYINLFALLVIDKEQRIFTYRDGFNWLVETINLIGR